MPSLPIRHRRRCPRPVGSSVPGSSSIVSQSEKKGGAFIDGCLGPDAAAMSRNDPLYGRQTDSGAFKLRILMQPLKGREELVGVLHIETGAVIHDVENRLVSLSLLPECDLGQWLFRRIFPGVPEQVHQ